MKTITGRTTAWLPGYAGPDDLAGKPDEAINTLGFSVSDMSSAGWSKVGPATITVKIPNEKELVENKVESLRQEIAKTRADAQNTVTGLETKIQKLLALEFTP